MNVTIVLGGSGGLGRKVMELLPSARDWSLETGVDLSSTISLALVIEKMTHEGTFINGIINCAGQNFIKPFDQLNWDRVEELMMLNAFSLPVVVQGLRHNGLLLEGAAICNVISNAAHIPMTHSLAYNASKAAQEMVTRQMARELKEYCIFGVNPNKLEGTGMSRSIESEVQKLRGWTAEEAHRYQIAALPAGVETPPAALAAFIAELMRPTHHPFITGCIFPYGGPQ